MYNYKNLINHGEYMCLPTSSYLETKTSGTTLLQMDHLLLITACEQQQQQQKKQFRSTIII